MHQTLTTTGKWSGCRARAPARTVGAGAPQTCPARSPSVTSRAGPARAPRQSKSGPLGQCNLAYRQPRDELALPLTPSPTIGPGHIDSPSASQPRDGLNSAPNHGPGPIPPFTTRAGASPRYRRQAHTTLGWTAGSPSHTRSAPIGLRWPRISCATACRTCRRGSSPSPSPSPSPNPKPSSNPHPNPHPSAYPVFSPTCRWEAPRRAARAVSSSRCRRRPAGETRSCSWARCRSLVCGLGFGFGFGFGLGLGYPYPEPP